MLFGMGSKAPTLSSRGWDILLMMEWMPLLWRKWSIKFKCLSSINTNATWSIWFLMTSTGFWTRNNPLSSLVLKAKSWEIRNRQYNRPPSWSSGQPSTTASGPRGCSTPCLAAKQATSRAPCGSPIRSKRCWRAKRSQLCMMVGKNSRICSVLSTPAQVPSKSLLLLNYWRITKEWQFCASSQCLTLKIRL